MLPDMVFGCLRQIIPDRAPAEGTSCIWNVTLRGRLADADTGTVAGAAGYDYNAAVLHDADGVPAECSAVIAAWAGGIWASGTPEEDLLDYDVPAGSAGGLYGLGQVINTTDGTNIRWRAEGFLGAHKVLIIAHGPLRGGIELRMGRGIGIWRVAADDQSGADGL